MRPVGALPAYFIMRVFPSPGATHPTTFEGSNAWRSKEFPFPTSESCQATAKMDSNQKWDRKIHDSKSCENKGLFVRGGGGGLR